MARLLRVEFIATACNNQLYVIRFPVSSRSRHPQIFFLSPSGEEVALTYPRPSQQTLANAKLFLDIYISYQSLKKTLSLVIFEGLPTSHLLLSELIQAVETARARGYTIALL